MTEFTTILTLSGIVYAIINYLKVPILKLQPTWGEYLIYVQFVVTFIVVLASDVNVLRDVTSNEILGLILTAMIAGGGSELIYSIQKKLTSVPIPAVIELAELEPIEAVATQRVIEEQPTYSGAYRPNGVR